MNPIDIITAIFNALGTIATNFVSFLTTLFDGIVGLFWVPATTGDNPVAAHLSVLGVFMLVSLATGLVIWAFNFIKNMVLRISNKAR